MCVSENVCVHMCERKRESDMGGQQAWQTFFNLLIQVVLMCLHSRSLNFFSTPDFLGMNEIKKLINMNKLQIRVKGKSNTKLSVTFSKSRKSGLTCCREVEQTYLKNQSSFLICSERNLSKHTSGSKMRNKFV